MSRSAMTHPRTFLFLLLLATVTCVVVVQFGLDNWVTTVPVFRLALDPNNTDVGPTNRTVQPLLMTETFLRAIDTTAATTSTTTTTTRSTRNSTPPNRKEPEVKPLMLVPGPPKNYLSQPVANGLLPASFFNGTQLKPGVSTRTKVEVSVRSFPGQVIPLNQESYNAILRQAVQGRRQGALPMNPWWHNPVARQPPAAAQGQRQRVDPYRMLKNVAPVSSEKVVRVLLVAYFRCGSTFVGDILQQNWKTFYHFEPLHYMTYDQRIGDEKVDEALDLLASLFRCDFAQFPNYVRWAWRPENRFLFRRNLYLWYMCRARPFVCFLPDFLRAVCQRAAFQVMKVTRLHMSHVHLFLRRNPDLDVKVVYLVRDPRGIISSRRGMDWCNTTNCSDPATLCSEMAEDIRVAGDIHRVDPLRCTRLRYEDICVRPEPESRSTFDFLGMPFSKTAEKFLKTHTVAKKSDGLDPYSTRRNSSTIPSVWRQRLNFSEVASVQEACGSVIRELGYELVNSPVELRPPTQTVPSLPPAKPAWVLNQRKRENG